MPLIEETYESNRSHLNAKTETQNRNMQFVELSNYRTFSEEQLKSAIKIYFKVLEKAKDEVIYRDLLDLVGHSTALID